MIILLAFLFRRIDRLSPAGDKWLKISLFFAFLLLEIVMIASFQTVLKSDSWKINDLTIYSAINGSLDPTVNDTFSSYFSVYSNNNLFTYILYFFYSALVQIGITSAKSLIFCGVLLNLQTLL